MKADTSIGCSLLFWFLKIVIYKKARPAIMQNELLVYDSGGGDRTHDLTGMNRTLSPAELHRHLNQQKISYNSKGHVSIENIRL